MSFFLHSFGHIGASIRYRLNTPGVVTAVLLGIPYPLLAFQRLFASGLITWYSLGISVLIGTAAIVLILLTVHFLGRRLG